MSGVGEERFAVIGIQHAPEAQYVLSIIQEGDVLQLKVDESKPTPYALKVFWRDILVGWVSPVGQTCPNCFQRVDPRVKYCKACNMDPIYVGADYRILCSRILEQDYVCIVTFVDGNKNLLKAAVYTG